MEKTWMIPKPTILSNPEIQEGILPTYSKNKTSMYREEEEIDLRTLKIQSSLIPPGQEVTEIQFLNHLKNMTNLHGIRVKIKS